MAHDKYTRRQKYISTDGGLTFNPVTPPEYIKGELIETDSVDCGAEVITWIPVEDAYICEIQGDISEETETDYGDYTITKKLNPDVIGTSCTPPSWYTGETDDTHEYYPGGNTSTGAGEYAHVIEEKTVFNGNGETVWTYWYLYWRITGKWVGGPYDETKAIYYNGEDGCLNGTYYDYSRYSGRIYRNMKIKPTPNIMKDFMKVNGKLFSLNFRCSTENNIEDDYLYIYDITGDELFKLKDLHGCKTVKTLTVDGTVVTITLTNSKHNTLTVKVNMRHMSLISSEFYEVTRWVATDYMCVGTDKYNQEKEQGSNDGGTTWTDTGNIRAGSIVETESEDCGYIGPHHYSNLYLTTEALGSGDISLKKGGSASYLPIASIKYSKNDGAWTSYTYGTNISVADGDKIRWKGTRSNGNNNLYYSYFRATANYKVYGNPLSLLKNDSFIDKPDAIYKQAYYRLFYNSSTLKDASNLALPATTLAYNCYEEMFRGCTSLTTSPELPAQKLEVGCYDEMFKDCSSLHCIRCLAVDLEGYSESTYTYSWVENVSSSGTFIKATSSIWTKGLNGIPSGWTVQNPFIRWTADTGYICVGNDKYNKEKEQQSTDEIIWTDTGSTRTGSTLIEHNSEDCPTTRWITVSGQISCAGTDKCYLEKEQTSTDGINWTDTGATRAGSTVIEANSTDCGYSPNDYSTQYITTEALGSGNISLNRRIEPAYGKEESDYDDKEPITNIQYSKNGGDWTSYTYSTQIQVVTGDKIRWRATIKDGNDFFYHSQFAATADYKAYGNPLSLLKNYRFVDEPDAIYEYAHLGLFYNSSTLKDISGLRLPATTLAWACYRKMFYNCTGLATVPSNLLPSTTLINYCYEFMFYNCTSLTTAPELPATTLAVECYYRMFGGCTSLNYIKCLATDTSASQCTYEWTDGVSDSGTFVKNPSKTWNTGISGIPSGWTVQDA